MRARHLLAAALVALAAAAPAHAQPPSGIVRPADEASMSQHELGAQLFAGNCASCHGSNGQGVTATAPQRAAGGIEGAGPSLRGVGALAADFYLRNGYMPLGHPGEQPERRPPLFNDREIRALVQYVAGFAPGPPIPSPQPQNGNLSEGLRLFTDHCAGCHQVVGEGGVVTGARVPQLKNLTPRQIAQAVRIGPFLMPTFPTSQISDSQLNSIIAYVQSVNTPDDRGGWGIGHIGPVPEGIVTWLIAAVALVALCVIIGERVRR